MKYTGRERYGLGLRLDVPFFALEKLGHEDFQHLAVGSALDPAQGAKSIVDIHPHADGHLDSWGRSLPCPPESPPHFFSNDLSIHDRLSQARPVAA